ncbi:MAG: NAD-dependent DNA ligase LigA [Saprospiraceae bacterium]
MSSNSDIITLTKSFLDQLPDKSKIKQLRQVIAYHEKRYYVEDDPLISDREYDILYNTLKNIELENPELIISSSPTQRVGGDIGSDFPPIKHIVPMLSLDNAYTADDLLSFDQSVKKLTGMAMDSDVIYCVEPKFDGGSIALVYENDMLVRAATRGNGNLGEDITRNAKILPSVPLHADFSKMGIKLVELRGEALIRRDKFDALNAQRANEGATLYANPRNAATGGLRTKDPSETRRRQIDVFIYQMTYAADINDDQKGGASHHENIEFLGTLGFKIPNEEKKLCPNIQSAIDFIQSWEEKRDNYAYEIDGMVVKVDDIQMQIRCGSTSHHPRWATAFKFKAKQAISTLLSVEYQVGKIGSITPVAKIKPVYLAGVNVSSISLHNEEFIRSKDIRIGDQVLVERAGDVIPYISKSLPELRTGNETEITFPEFCPVNDTSQKIALIKEEGESAWRCPDCVCGNQPLQKMIFHVSKEAMDIDGFGKSYVEKFYSLGWLKDMSDIYNLDYELIANLDGFGRKSADNLKQSIEKAKNNPIHRLLHSLSIHHLGKRASKLIAEEILHVFNLLNWDLDRYTAIKDIGPVVAQNIMSWLNEEKNVAMLRRMESLGVNLAQTEADMPLLSASEGKLAGKTILFTGTLLQMGRKEAETLAAKQGAKLLSAVSSNLNILVVGEKAGSKLKKAESLGTVEIWTEGEFISQISQE